EPHARRAAGAALALQEATGAVAAAHPGWPRFRVGVNTGLAAVGVVGTGGGRTYTVIGDTVNVASRLEGHAPVAGVVVGAATRAALGGGAITEPLGERQVKGREGAVEAYVLRGLVEG
ncbi:adenylate/guanylate cyclase domain-containing protein, partial [Agromyces tardus]